MTKQECVDAQERLLMPYYLSIDVQNLYYESNGKQYSIADDSNMITKLILEYFKLVEENRKLKIALDNAIKECCINVNGSDACSSLDELYKSFEKKVWEDVN